MCLEVGPTHLPAFSGCDRLGGVVYQGRTDFLAQACTSPRPLDFQVLPSTLIDSICGFLS